MENTTLRHLDIGTNHSGNEGAIAMAKALAFNSSLTRLCLVLWVQLGIGGPVSLLTPPPPHPPPDGYINLVMPEIR